jgi:Inner membrane component of T3SS, cytoplasmic domain
MFAGAGDVWSMTIQAQIHPLSPVEVDPRDLRDRPTAGLDAHHTFPVDSFSLLDHRTRVRAMPRELAPPGRYLSIDDGEDAKLIALDRPITHIGRGLSADVRIEDTHVSRRHAIVALRADGARLLDDRSFNGTYVNGRAVTIAYLSDGDVLRVGRVAFRYVEIDAPATPARSRSQPLRRIPLARLGRRLVPAGAAA